MVPDTPNLLDQLLPDRHPQADFFICDVADAILKDLIPQMEHPFYVLSKKPETAVRRYEHGDKWLEVIPSAKGQATIYDKDILIYVVSQIMHRINRGEKVERRIRFNPRDLLIFVNRGTGGKDYEAFCEALDRLMGTVIKTNITTTGGDQDDVPMGDEERLGWFHLIESAHINRKNNEAGGRIMSAEIQISEWIFNGIRRKSVLTLHRDYFRLRKPIERRVYEIARKMCGARPELEIGLEKLLKRTGARTELKRFRHTLREIATHNHLPDYLVAYDEVRDMVIFKGRGTVVAIDPAEKVFIPPLSSETYDHARRVAPGWDVRVLEQEWRSWADEIPKNADAAFLGFCKRRSESTALR
ncbi:replication initiator protein A [Puniceibacterium sp. IMCC21224]|uniref:replication initiator protein A n=1 Tax=Puniceibacterium sp. IMCC21224 TaxID=1618204 RepID=UPI00064D904B|nr:replication initiator protein A [Puniceibacterium sp. IMCC21224]KMK63837.1 Replication initiator protein A [Puniceibacterium sp. IMCC21224]